MFAPEGLWFILTPLLLTVLLAVVYIVRKRRVFVFLSLFSLLFLVGMLFFFRNPDCAKPAEDAIVAPTHGRILGIDTTATGGTHITVFLSLCDVHAVRAPIYGEVIDWEWVPGKYLPAFHKDAGKRNQHVRVVLSTTHGPVAFRVISGAIARRVIVPVKIGDTLEPGQRIGFVRFGSRCEMEFPRGFEPAVKVGDRLVGGETIMGAYDDAVEVKENVDEGSQIK